MRAIILAAGAGTRLQPLTDQRPKCLVPVGGRSLLDHQVGALQRAGVDDLVVVLGYEQQQVRRHLGARAAYVVNEDWASTNSIVSLHRATSHLDGDVLLCNCDILFDADVVRRLTARDGSAIAVDTRARREAGEMNVAVDAGGVVTAIGKDLDPETAQAVSVQVVRFDADSTALVRAEVDRLVREQVREAFPTSAYGPLIAARRLAAVDVGDLAWTEIDTLEDHARAEGQVAPRLSSVGGAGAGGRR